MTCAACEAAVQKAVSKVDGVEDVTVSLMGKSMRVNLDPRVEKSPEGKEQILKDIVRTVEKAGYEAEIQDEMKEASQKANSDATSKPIHKSIPKSSSTRKASEASQLFVEEAEELRQRLLYSLPLLGLLMVVSMGPMLSLPLPAFLQGTGGASNYALVQLLLCTPILWINRSFFIRGGKSLIRLHPTMDSLVAVGAISSYLYGIFALMRINYGLGFQDHDLVHLYRHQLYFEGAGMILTLITLGKYWEVKAKMKTRSALEGLIRLQPQTTKVLQNGIPIEVPIEDVKVGDLVLIKPGETIPLDGTVTEGLSAVNEAAITGESLPVSKGPGDKVIGASINQNGSFTFRVEAVGEDTTLSQIIQLVEEAASSKAPIQSLADKIAGVFVPIVIGIAIFTFVIWTLTGSSFEFALRQAISILVISCPCALGLATPVVIMVATGQGAKHGLLIRTAGALQTLAEVDTIILDKTGTLTEGTPYITDIILCTEGVDSEEVLTLAAALESRSEQPLAKAVLAAHKVALESDHEDTHKAAPAQAPSLPPIENFAAIPGRGLRGRVEGKHLLLGNDALMVEEGISLDSFHPVMNDLAQEGKTLMFLASIGENSADPSDDASPSQILGILAAADLVKNTSPAAIQALHRQGLETIMLTGDKKETAQAIAQELGIQEIIAQVLPQEKDAAVQKVQSEGGIGNGKINKTQKQADKAPGQKKKVAMVGDGINDAPALMRADVGIALGAGTDMARDAADIILVHSDLQDVGSAIDLAKRSLRKIKENYFWAFFYNVLCIPIAGGILYPKWGISLNPMIAAACMSLSSVFVVSNALSLNRFQVNHPFSYEPQRAQVPQPQVRNMLSLLPATNNPNNQNQKNQKKASKNGLYNPSKNRVSQDIVYDISKGGTNMKKQVIIEGMMCDHCKARVQEALEGLGDVHVTVSLPEKMATLKSHNAEIDLSDGTIQKTIEDIGYKVVEIRNI